MWWQLLPSQFVQLVFRAPCFFLLRSGWALSIPLLCGQFIDSPYLTLTLSLDVLAPFRLLPCSYRHFITHSLPISGTLGWRFKPPSLSPPSSPAMLCPPVLCAVRLACLPLSPLPCYSIPKPKQPFSAHLNLYRTPPKILVCSVFATSSGPSYPFLTALYLLCGAMKERDPVLSHMRLPFIYPYCLRS